MTRIYIRACSDHPKKKTLLRAAIHKEGNTNEWITRPLVIRLLLRTAGRKSKSGLASDGISLVLDGQLGQVANEVLDLGVGLGAVLAAEVVEPRDLAQDVVDHGDDDGDTDRVGPDDNDGDNVDITVDGVLGGGRRAGLLEVTRQPAEDGEESSKRIDTQDGSNELPRWPGLSTTGDEDQPVLGQRDLEEQDLLRRTEVLDQTTVGQEEVSTDNPSGNGQEETKDDGNDPDLGQLPLDRAHLEVSIVVGNGDGGQVSEEGDEDDQVSADGLVDDDHGGDQVDLEVETQSDTVLDVGLHALEDLTGQLDGIDDGAQTGSEEDNVGGSLVSLGGTLDGNTTVGLLEGRSVVDTVTRHGSQVTTLLQHLDDLVLVLGEHLSETVGLLNQVVLTRTSETAVDQTVSVVDLGTQSKHLAGLLGNGDGVTSQHLDGQTKVLGLSDGVGSVLTGRVEHGQHAEQLPGLTLLLDSDTQGTETTAGELGGLLLVEASLLLGALGQVEDSLGGTLGTGVADAIARADRGDALGHRVEGSELLGDPVAGQDLTSLGVAAQGQDGDLVDGVQVLDVVRRSNGRNSHHPVHIHTLGDIGLTDGQLVGGEGSGLVRAEHVDTGEGLDGSELLHDGLLLGQVGGTDSQGGSRDDGETDGDTDDEQDQGVVEQVDRAVLRSRDLEVTEETTNPSGENPEHDQHQQGSTDLVHDRLEVTLVLGTLNQRSGLADEGVLGGSGDDGVGLATLATGGVVAGVSHVLVDREGFTSDGGLVDSDDGSTGVVLHAFVLVVLLLEGVIVGRGEHLLVDLEHLGLGVVADETNIGRDDVTLLQDDLDLDVRQVPRRTEGTRDRDLQCHQEPAHEQGSPPRDHRGQRQPSSQCHPSSWQRHRQPASPGTNRQ